MRAASHHRAEYEKNLHLRAPPPRVVRRGRKPLRTSSADNIRVQANLVSGVVERKTPFRATAPERFSRRLGFARNQIFTAVFLSRRLFDASEVVADAADE